MIPYERVQLARTYADFQIERMKHNGTVRTLLRHRNCRPTGGILVNSMPYDHPMCRFVADNAASPDFHKILRLSEIYIAAWVKTQGGTCNPQLKGSFQQSKDGRRVYCMKFSIHNFKSITQ